MHVFSGICLGLAIGWCFLQSILCRRRIKYLEVETLKLWECVAHGSLIKAMEGYYQALHLTGKCLECGSKDGTGGVIHTEDCPMLELIEKFDALYKGRGGA
jgi:hypothetical protein